MLGFTQAGQAAFFFWLIFVEDRIGLAPAATYMKSGERVICFWH
jgi:hypothetical protein